MESILEVIEKNKDIYLSELKEFLKFPSISTKSENNPDMRACAEWLRDKLERTGLQNVSIMETKGHPVVYADWLDAGKDRPTILIYGHYDVQPVDPIGLWTSPPFEAEVRGENIYARGAADDKGQVFIHLKALELHLKNSGTLPVNIKMLIEGEEEIGSVHISDFLKDNKDLFQADVVVVSDTSMYSKDTQSLGYALRGLCYMEVEVIGPNRDLHSGSYGGAVDNPINALANIISKLKDENGKILIDGFYDDVINLNESERNEFSKLNFDENILKNDLALKKVYGEQEYSALERMWARPTLDCNGICGGFIEEGAKTVLPSKAFAKISMRLVPGQEPDKIEKLFREYLKKITPDTIKVSVRGMHHGKPYIADTNNVWFKSAAKSIEKVFGKPPVFVRVGGSIPVVNDFREILKLDSVLLGFGLPDENSHSADEHLNLGNFFNGIATCHVFYNELSKIN